MRKCPYLRPESTSTGTMLSCHALYGPPHYCGRARCLTPPCGFDQCWRYQCARAEAARRVAARCVEFMREYDLPACPEWIASEKAGAFQCAPDRCPHLGSECAERFALLAACDALSCQKSRKGEEDDVGRDG